MCTPTQVCAMEDSSPLSLAYIYITHETPPASGGQMDTRTNRKMAKHYTNPLPMFCLNKNYNCGTTKYQPCYLSS